jgi:hypothetical protein
MPETIDVLNASVVDSEVLYGRRLDLFGIDAVPISSPNHVIIAFDGENITFSNNGSEYKPLYFSPVVHNDEVVTNNGEVVTA